MSAQQQKVLEIYCVHPTTTHSTIQPGVAVCASHECSPEWVADVMYTIFSTYLDIVSDEDQIGYGERVRELITHRFRIGYDHINPKIIITKSLDDDDE